MMPETRAGARPEQANTPARVFFALWPDAAAAAALQAQIPGLQQRFGGRAVPQEALHLTLAFLGSVERSRLPLLCELASRIEFSRFELQCDELGEWQRQGIVWAGPSAIPAGLLRLREKLEVALAEADFVLPAHRFVPHVSLLRGARCATRREALTRPAGWAVSDFVLAESKLGPRGASYELLWRSAAALK